MCKSLAMALAAWCCLLCILLVAVSVHGFNITLQNHCSDSVVACAQSGTDAISEYRLEPEASQVLKFSSCTWPSGAIWRSVRQQCVADGGGPGDANDRELANLALFDIEPGSDDTYHLSNVYAYNIAIRIGPVDAPDCSPISCSISESNLPPFCGLDNQLESFPDGILSCINTDGPQGSQTNSTVLFKYACLTAYSYNGDNDHTTFTCAHGTSYHVTFCPSENR